MDSTANYIFIQGSRENNLKNISLALPRNKLIIFTGISGSGKSSIVYETIYREGQRRYLESMPAHLHRFLEQVSKPKVDSITGLSPTLAIEQASMQLTYGKRSTVGTTTEIYDYLRLLYAKIGVLHSPVTGMPIKAQTVSQMVDAILSMPVGVRLYLLAPVVSKACGSYCTEKLVEIQKGGFQRIRIDQNHYHITECPKLNNDTLYSLDVIVDRLILQNDIATRLADSLEIALNLSDGFVTLEYENAASPPVVQEAKFSVRHVCPVSGFSFGGIEPGLFSFNSPKGACPFCRKAHMSWPTSASDNAINKSWESFFDVEKYEKQSSLVNKKNTTELSKVCSACNGYRLRPEALMIKIDGQHIGEIAAMRIDDAQSWFNELPNKLDKQSMVIAAPLLTRISERLQFLSDVGLEHLTLSRPISEISSGEMQRVRLASQLGFRLTGITYVLDGPSVGLHPFDNRQILKGIIKLRDFGNTVIIADHDETTIMSADYVVDIGPGAGQYGGEVVFVGTVMDLIYNDKSLTGKYLSGEMKSCAGEIQRQVRSSKMLKLKNATGNNLKSVTGEFPIGGLTCITGVSGSGKSTFIIDTLFPAVVNELKSKGQICHSKLNYESIEGVESIDKVVVVDQSAVVGTARSNLATYLGFFSVVRRLFAALPEAQARGYGPRRFSYNFPEGQCSACCGHGSMKVQMHLLPTVDVLCEVCCGSRYNRETLGILFKGHSIADILAMSVREAAFLFSSIPGVGEKLLLLSELGLEHVTLGRQTVAMSLGELRRVKLAKELAHSPTGKSLYLLDEASAGLHFHEIAKLMKVLHGLVECGNTVIMIEHNIDIIMAADWVLDFGPAAGDAGGEIIAFGRPTEIMSSKHSYTGTCMSELFRQRRSRI